jgi:Fic family protein
MKSSGEYISHGSYKTFQPQLLSEPVNIVDDHVTILLADAMRYLGELNAYSQLVPDIDYFIRMHIAKEATTSSKIEGTNTNLIDVIQDGDQQQNLNEEQRDDLEEVQNYIRAVNLAVEKLNTLPLATRLICETHEILLSGVRGFTRAPGQIRKTQNWIGGSTISDAVFVPPAPDTVQDLLSDLEKYWHDDASNTPTLIKMALAHYQFETIHPFLDGNGRTGRLMISLQLIDADILQKPTLYISDFFERHRSSYYDSLERVRTSGDYSQWVKFFLSAVCESAQDAKETLQAIVKLKTEYTERVHASSLSRPRQEKALALITTMYGQPVMTVKQIQEEVNSSWQTANDLAVYLKDIGILDEITGDAKNRKFQLYEYFDLFNKPRRNHE